MALSRLTWGMAWAVTLSTAAACAPAAKVSRHHAWEGVANSVHVGRQRSPRPVPVTAPAQQARANGPHGAWRTELQAGPTLAGFASVVVQPSPSLRWGVGLEGASQHTAYWDHREGRPYRASTRYVGARDTFVRWRRGTASVQLGHLDVDASGESVSFARRVSARWPHEPGRRRLAAAAAPWGLIVQRRLDVQAGCAPDIGAFTFAARRPLAASALAFYGDAWHPGGPCRSWRDCPAGFLCTNSGRCATRRLMGPVPSAGRGQEMLAQAVHVHAAGLYLDGDVPRLMHLRWRVLLATTRSWLRLSPGGRPMLWAAATPAEGSQRRSVASLWLRWGQTPPHVPDDVALFGVRVAPPAWPGDAAAIVDEAPELDAWSGLTEAAETLGVPDPFVVPAAASSNRGSGPGACSARGRLPHVGGLNLAVNSQAAWQVAAWGRGPLATHWRYAGRAKTRGARLDVSSAAPHVWAPVGMLSRLTPAASGRVIWQPSDDHALWAEAGLHLPGGRWGEVGGAHQLLGRARLAWGVRHFLRSRSRAHMAMDATGAEHAQGSTRTYVQAELHPGARTSASLRLTAGRVAGVGAIAPALHIRHYRPNRWGGELTAKTRATARRWAVEVHAWHALGSRLRVATRIEAGATAKMGGARASLQALSSEGPAGMRIAGAAVEAAMLCMATF